MSFPMRAYILSQRMVRRSINRKWKTIATLDAPAKPTTKQIRVAGIDREVFVGTNCTTLVVPVFRDGSFWQQHYRPTGLKTPDGLELWTAQEERLQ